MEASADKQRLDRDFTELYRAHLRDVYSYAYYRIGNHHDAEDLTEQTFLQAYRHFDRAQRESNGRPLRPWLIRIAHNLAANYSRELADFIIYVIDVSGGDKIPRKGGPGITQSDLLIVNKTDLAEIVGADLGVMDRDARKMREGGPTIFVQVKNGKGVDAIVDFILSAWKSCGAAAVSKQ